MAGKKSLLILELIFTSFFLNLNFDMQAISCYCRDRVQIIIETSGKLYEANTVMNELYEGLHCGLPPVDCLIMMWLVYLFNEIHLTICFDVKEF